MLLTRSERFLMEQVRTRTISFICDNLGVVTDISKSFYFDSIHCGSVFLMTTSIISLHDDLILLAFHHYDNDISCIYNTHHAVLQIFFFGFVFFFDEESLKFHLEPSNFYFLLFLFPVDYQAANDCDLEHVAYEFFTQAFVLYEEEIAVIVHSSVNVSIKSP